MNMIEYEFLSTQCTLVVLVNHVTIVAIGHGLLKKFWPLVLFETMQTRLLR